ncbi:MAG TPA: glycosyltransferase [Crinalium sp.]
MISQRGALNVAHAINADAPDILLDMGSGPWKGIIERHIRCNALLADVIHDVQFHPDRWRSLLQLYSLIYPRKADIFISASEYSHKQLLNSFPEKMHICSHHGVIHSPEEVDSDAIANNRNQLLFFGRIEKYKGIEVLLDAFEIAKKTDPTLHLTIAGLGPLSSNLKDKIFGLNIKLINRWIDDKELNALLASHGVVVMPYLSATQSGVAAIAIANGLPAIGTNVGALPEQIIDGKNGLIVPPNDPAALASAMVAIAQDYKLSYRMSQETCQMATTIYSWNNIGHELLENLKKYSA